MADVHDATQVLADAVQAGLLPRRVLGMVGAIRLDLAEAAQRPRAAQGGARSEGADRLGSVDFPL